MKDEQQIKLLIEIYLKQIDSKKFRDIKNAIISRKSSNPPKSNTIEYTFKKYFEHCSSFCENLTEEELKPVLNYFCKYKSNAIEYNESKKKYILNTMVIDIKNEEEILNILSIYDNE